MRKLIVLVVVAGLPSLAAAQQKKKAKQKADPRVTWVEDEPVSPAATGGHSDPSALEGTRREASMPAPEVGKVVVTGETRAARVPSALPEQRDEGSASGDAIDELVARQVERMMRKNQGSIDACVKEAVRRHPALNGSVRMEVVVADKKVKSLHVSSDTVHDIDLDACLVKAGQGWKLQLAAARFTWPVTLSASR
jgi:hypothetical protein